MDDAEILEAVRFFWFVCLIFWLLLYCYVQLSRFTNGDFFRGPKKRLIERRVSRNQFLRYMGIILVDAPYLYPVRSLLVWIVLFTLSVKLT